MYTQNIFKKTIYINTIFAGGGPYKAINDTLSEQVREIIRPAVEGLSNAFDNDYIPGVESINNVLFFNLFM